MRKTTLEVRKMFSLRPPFLFSQPPSKLPSKSHFSRSISAAIAAAVGFGAVGFAISHKLKGQKADPLFQNPWHFFFPSTQSPSFSFWGSLSLAANSSETAVEPRTGVSFPAVLNETQRLLGIGLRKKSILGLKNIDVYAFGVYADDGDMKKLFSEKYRALSVFELKQNKDFYADVLDQDVCMTVRLQIVYHRLSISSVRSAFEESVGGRIKKFSGSDDKELLQKFTSQFKDEYKIPQGSIIDLSKERGHILRTKIDGKEVGSIQSKLLCRSILDLYVGEDPFDRQAKEEIELGLASLLQK